MPNMDAANVFYMGVCFGQINSYATLGIKYNLIQRTIYSAAQTAQAIPQLSMQQPLFTDMLNRLGGGTGSKTDTVTNGVSLSALSNKYLDQMAHIIPYPNVLYVGYFLGNAESFSSPPVKEDSLNKALDLPIPPGVWTNREGIINWAQSRSQAPYYQEAIYTARRLLHSELVGRPQQFSAGTANIEIVIGAGQSLLDKTYARVVVIDDGHQRGAVVQVDTTSLDVTNVIPIKELVNSIVKMDGIFLVATHSHSPSNTISTDPTTFTNNVADAIILAAGDLIEAEVGVAKGQVLQSFNRVVRTGDPPKRTSVRDWIECMHPNERLTFLQKRNCDPVYHDIDILHIRSKSDTITIATLVNYAAHAVFFKNPIKDVSADYPGAIVNYVSLPLAQGGLGGECLFLQGAAGDIHPFCGLNDDKFNMNLMATDIGATVVNKTLAITAYESSFPILFTEKTFDLRNTDQKKRWRFYANDPLYPSDNYPADPAGMNPPPPGTIRKYETPISALLLGKHIAFVGMPGEFFTSLGQNLRMNSPCKNTFFLGYCNDFIQYVPSADDWETGAYGTTNKVVTRHSNGDVEYDYCRIEKGIGEEMVGQALELIGDLMKK